MLTVVHTAGCTQKNPSLLPGDHLSFRRRRGRGMGGRETRKLNLEGEKKGRKGGRSEENQTGDGGFGSHYHSKVVA